MKLLFDIGGSHTRIAMSKDEKSLENYLKKDTQQNFEKGIKHLKDMAEKVASIEQVDSICVGIAGIVKDGILLNSPNLKDWEGKNIEKEIKKIFSIESVRVKNDAILGCVGEANYGAGKGYDIVAFLAIGTGIGGAKTENGKIDSYDYGFEPGKQIIDESTLETLEDLAGGKIFSGFPGKVEDLNKEQMDDYINKLCVGIHNLVTIWSPDVFVLGGGIILNNPNLVELIKSRLPDIFKDYPKIPPLKIAELGDKSTLWGGLIED